MPGMLFHPFFLADKVKSLTALEKSASMSLTSDSLEAVEDDEGDSKTMAHSKFLFSLRSFFLHNILAYNKINS